MNAFDDPIEETQANLLLAQSTFKQWQARELESPVALQRLGQAAGQLEVVRAIWMETARQAISRLSTRTERELLNFCELVKGIDNQKDYGVSLLEHVQKDAIASLDAGLALNQAQDKEEAAVVGSVLHSCAFVLAIKAALLETIAFKATIEGGGETSQVEELKKRIQVVSILLEHLRTTSFSTQE